MASKEDVEKLMKRCQIGVGGKRALDEAHDIMAECYGTLGWLQNQIEKLEKPNINEQIGEACNKAAGELPEGYQISFVIERHGYDLFLNVKGNEYRSDSDTIAGEFDELIEIAKSHAKG